MSIVARTRSFVVGVDTHARAHVYAIVVAATGECLAVRDFPTTHAGIKRAISWVDRITDADRRALWAVEGAASYGAVLAGTLVEAGYFVAEAPKTRGKTPRGAGKSDVLDATRIAVATLGIDEARLAIPRLTDGVRASLRVLIAARDDMSDERTAKVNALTALVRVNDLGIDARRALKDSQITEISKWRSRDEDIALATARGEAIRLASRIGVLSDELEENKKRLVELVSISEAAPLLAEKGIGAVTAAVCLTAWSHKGRLRSAAAYCSLAGVNPIPASSGNTVRHRLNRGGDRRLNQALHMAVICRMTHDVETRAYVEKRRAEGKTDREIRRCLKRYLARQVYRKLNAHVSVISPP